MTEEQRPAAAGVATSRLRMWGYAAILAAMAFSQSAGKIPWFTEYPYAFYHGDTTPFWILAFGEYWKQTADTGLVRELWTNLRKAYDWSRATDKDGDGLMENPVAGAGALEVGDLQIGILSDVYLSGVWIAALDREMNFYQHCPFDHGYPRFACETFLDASWTPNTERTDIIPSTQNGMGIISYLKFHHMRAQQQPAWLATACLLGDYLVKEALTPDTGTYPAFTRSTGRRTQFPQPADCGSQRAAGERTRRSHRLRSPGSKEALLGALLAGDRILDSREPQRYHDQLAACEQAFDRGGKVVALTMPVLVEMNMSFRNYCALFMLPGWSDVMNLPVPERRVRTPRPVRPDSMNR